jgi:hypothetical protein
LYIEKVIKLVTGRQTVPPWVNIHRLTARSSPG